MRAIKKLPFHKKQILIRLLAVALAIMGSVMMLSQNAFAQNTYRITDGGRVTYHTTTATDPGEVLDEAGVDLGMEDTYTTAQSGGVSEIHVKRGQRDTSVTVTEVYTKVIPYETRELNDAQLVRGQKQILTAGKDGEMQCTAQVTYVNGVETERTVLFTQVTTAPVEELVAVGCGDDQMAAGNKGELYIGDGVIITPEGNVLTYTDSMRVEATAYNHNDAGCDMWTATGTRVRWGTVAVDPRIIPYGTQMYIVDSSGAYIYGLATAEDCGGGIKGERIDLYMPTMAECFQFGRRDCTIYFLG